MRMKLFTLLVLLIATVMCRAEQALVLHLLDGSTAVFVLPDEPRISMSGKEVTVQSGGESASYALGDVERFALEDVDLTGVEDVVSREVFRVGGAGLQCDGLRQGERVEVYDLGGSLVCRCVAGTDGGARVTLGHGVYVVKTGNRSFKIVKR